MTIERAEFLGSSPLVVELLDSGLWKLLAPLVFRSKVLDRIVHVPLGYLTDFASVPRIPIAYLLAGNRCFKAAALHDCALETMPRDDAAKLFLEAMEVEGVPETVRKIMYAGVRLHDQSYRPAPDYVPPAD